MNKKIMLLPIALILLFATATAFTFDINSANDSQSDAAIDEAEDGVQCVPDDGNFVIVITDANATAVIDVMINGTLQIGTGAASCFETTDANCNIGLGGAYDDNTMTSDGGDGTSAATLTIAAPSAEGLHYICAWDQNATGGSADYCEWVSVKPDSTYTKYTLTHDDANGFCETTVGALATFAGKIEDNTGYGRIEPAETNTYDLSGDIDLDATINWANTNKVTVTTSVLVNQLTKLTFLKPVIHSSKFEIRRNDSACSICRDPVSNNGTIYFTTNTFSVYEVVDMPAGESGGGGIVFQPAQIIPGGGDIVAAVPGGMSTIVIVLIIVAIVVIVKIKN